MQFEMAVGLSTAVGSLPHVDPRAAAELSLRCNPGLPAIPSLPMRSPWETMLGQAVVGLPGVTVGDRGGVELVEGGPAAMRCPTPISTTRPSAGCALFSTWPVATTVP